MWPLFSPGPPSSEPTCWQWVSSLFIAHSDSQIPSLSEPSLSHCLDTAPLSVCPQSSEGPQSLITCWWRPAPFPLSLFSLPLPFAKCCVSWHLKCSFLPYISWRKADGIELSSPQIPPCSFPSTYLLPMPRALILDLHRLFIALFVNWAHCVSLFAWCWVSQFCGLLKAVCKFLEGQNKVPVELFGQLGHKIGAN